MAGLNPPSTQALSGNQSEQAPDLKAVTDSCTFGRTSQSRHFPGSRLMCESFGQHPLASQRGTGMDLGLLLLRFALAAILYMHATQKLFGWFSGPGLDRAGEPAEQLLRGVHVEDRRKREAQEQQSEIHTSASLASERVLPERFAHQPASWEVT